MKKSLLILFVITVLLSICLYIWGGSRGLFFRLSLIVVLIELGLLIINFRNTILLSFRRGKMARVKSFESLAILIFGMALIILVKSFDWNIDWTSRGLFNISPETKNIISKINSPLKIILFSYPESDDGLLAVNTYAKKLAERYEARNPKWITFEIIDPIRNKMIADEYGIKQNGTLIFEMNNKREYILPNLLIERAGDTGIDYKGETIFSAVIDKLIQNKITKIAYLTGQGELNFNTSGIGGYDRIKKMLLDRQYQFKAINLDHYPNIPEDTDIFIIADPQVQFSMQVYHSIEKFIKNGGSMLYLVGQHTIDINILLIQSGFAYIPNIAIDPSLVSKNNGELSIIPLLSPISEITTRLRNKNLSVLFPSASIIARLSDDKTDTNFVYDINVLARTSQYGFGERNFEEKVYRKDDNDIVEIKNLALSSIIAKKSDLDEQRRAVIFGSLDFIDNSRIDMGGNSQLFLNAIDFLLRKDLKMSVPSKLENLALSIPNPQDSRAIAILVIIWLLLLLTMGAIVLITRQNKIKEKK